MTPVTIGCVNWDQAPQTLVQLVNNKQLPHFLVVTKPRPPSSLCSFAQDANENSWRLILDNAGRKGGVRVVTNAGEDDPLDLKQRIVALCENNQWSHARVAAVYGDDVTG